MSERVKWPDEQTAVMRGLFHNLLHEARRIEQGVFSHLGSCDSCGHLFDRRDKRHHAEPGAEWCPACNAEQSPNRSE